METELHTTRHLHVAAEVVEGIVAIADDGHQFATETLDEVDDTLAAVYIGQYWCRLHKHTIGIHQSLVHTAVVDGAIDDLFLTAGFRQDVTEGSHEKKVWRRSILLTPLVDSFIVQVRILVDGVAQRVGSTRGNGGKLHIGKLLGIVLLRTFISITLQCSLFVLGVFIHAIGDFFQGLTLVRCGEIAEGDAIAKCQTIGNGMVYLKEYIVVLGCLNELYTTEGFAAQQVVRTYKAVLEVAVQFLVRHGFPFDGNHHVWVGVLLG